MGDLANEEVYWIPEHVRGFLRNMGFTSPLEAMEPYIREWDDWMSARGEFYDYDDRDSFGRRYKVHRRSIHPAMRVCREWGSLLLNERTVVVTENEKCTEWLADYFNRTGFMAAAQASVVRAMGLGTAAWALWFDLGQPAVRIRHYDARMVVPLTWDEDGVTECAFVTRVFHRGKAVDQLQLHLCGDLSPEGRELAGILGDVPTLPNAVPKNSTVPYIRNSSNVYPAAAKLNVPGVPSVPNVPKSQNVSGVPTNYEGVSVPGENVTVPNMCQENVSGKTYKIVTVCFDENGQEIVPPGVVKCLDTGLSVPTFALVKPAIANTRVDMSPYGQSVYADAVDALQAVDLTFDAMVSEVDLAKMRVFLSDVMFDMEKDGKRTVPIPFGKSDCTVFRKVASTEDVIQEYAPALRTKDQVEALRIALQMLGDLCGFGLTYFDFDSTGYVKTATEVASDNSALLRNVRAHENSLERALATISHGVLAAARVCGESLPPEGEVTVNWDDSIVQDTAALKQQDMAEVGVTMQPWEYRAKWYGEDEPTAKARALGLETPGRDGGKLKATER